MSIETNTILIVEDNEGDVLLIREYLKSSLPTYITKNCKTLFNACEVLQNQRFDLIFLDLSLPDSIDHKSIIKTIQEAAKDTPVIILTGYSDKKFAIESLHLGIQDYVMKEELTEAVLSKSFQYSIERHKINTKLKTIQQQRERDIADAVLESMEKNKNELAIELHDNIGQLLTGIKIFLSFAHKNNNVNMLEEAKVLLQQTITEVRKLSHTLTPPDFTEASLGNVLLKLINQYKIATNLNINLDYSKEDLIKIPQKLALNIYRIIQEQFTNIIKHAKATNIEVIIHKDADIVYLEIKDNGIGFIESEIHDGIGLRNIKSRVALYNGQTHIISNPGNGCTIKMNFNIND